MVIKVHGLSMSTCTQRVMMTLKEKNVPFELVPVNLMNGEQKKPEFLKKQPFGVIPVLEDDDYLIYESRGICRYLEQKYKDQGSALTPNVTDVKAFGKFEQAASVEIFNYDTCASGIVFEKLFKKMMGLGETDEAKVKQLTEKLEQTLNVYEQILSKQKYLAGNEFTLVDLFHIPYTAHLFKLGFNKQFEARPNVMNWWNACTERQAWQDTLNTKL